MYILITIELENMILKRMLISVMCHAGMLFTLRMSGIHFKLHRTSYKSSRKKWLASRVILFLFFILIYTKMYLTMYRKCNFIENIIINNVGFRQQARWNVHAFYVIP